MMKKALALLALFCLSIGLPAHAGRLDLLLIPGELTAAHAEFEQACEQCHQTLKKQKQALHCLGSHDHADIRHDIEHQQGFHGRLPPQQRKQCRHCHTDHAGREKHIVILDTDSFDHRQTDYSHKGGHR